jgi:outer membrane receptor protein involved in Fe transport
VVPDFKPPAVPIDITDDTSKTGLYYGFYLQDKWHVFTPLIINFGGRFDVVDEYAHANQLSPRVNIVLKATSFTTLHAGYSKYFTAATLELVNNRDLAKFVGTTNQAEVNESSPVQPERADYFDAGITQQFTSAFSMGVDAYYKEAHDLLDLGQFGAAQKIQVRFDVTNIFNNAYELRTGSGIGVFAPQFGHRRGLLWRGLMAVLR